MLKNFFKKFAIVCLCWGIMSSNSLIDSRALDNKSRALEIITLKKTLEVGQYGHIIWYADLTYNATTGISTLKKIRHEDYLSADFTFSTVTSITTNPAIGGVVKPTTSTGVTITFYIMALPGLGSQFTTKLTTSTS